MTEFIEVGGPNGLPEFITPAEAKRRQIVGKLIDGILSEKHLFVADAPDEQVTLGSGRMVNLRDRVVGLVGQLEDAFDATDKARAKVRSDPGLTPEGKQERLAALDRALADRIREIGDGLPLDALEDRLAEMRRQIEAPHPRLDPDDTEQAWERAEQAREVRQLLRQKDENERLRILMAAAESDDRATLLAFEEAPQSFRLVPEDELALAREVHVEVRYPQRKARADALSTGISRLRSNVNQAMGLLAHQTGAAEFNVAPLPSGPRGRAGAEAEAALAEA